MSNHQIGWEAFTHMIEKQHHFKGGLVTQRITHGMEEFIGPVSDIFVDDAGASIYTGTCICTGSLRPEPRHVEPHAFAVIDAGGFNDFYLYADHEILVCVMGEHVGKKTLVHLYPSGHPREIILRRELERARVASVEQSTEPALKHAIA